MSTNVRRAHTLPAGAALAGETPSRPSWRRSRGRALRAAATLLAGTAALAAAGCGGSSPPPSTATADPASVAPASASLYVGATLRPGATLSADADAIASKVSGLANPFQTIVANLGRSSKHPVSWKTDVDPWLGSKVGLFLTSFGAGIPSMLHDGLSTSPFGKGIEGALVLDTKDASTALTFLDKQASYSSPRKATYRGVSYEVTSDGTAVGVVDGFAVIGSEAGLHQVIDTDKGGSHLSEAVDFTRLRSGEEPSTVADLYLNVDGVLNGLAASESKSSMTLAVIKALLSAVKLHTFDLSLGAPSATSATVDAITPGGGASSGHPSAEADGPQVLAELPGDAWLAVGLSHFGQDATQAVSVLETIAALGGVNLTQVLAELSAAGFDVHQDLLSWMGAAGFYARGTTLASLQAALVIDSNNPALSRQAVVKLGELLQAAGLTVTSVSLPDTDAAFSIMVDGLPIVFADGESKFIVGLGTASVATALGPAGTLASSPTYAAARTALGSDIMPSVLLNFPMLVNAINGLGLGNGGTIASALPVLQSLGELAAGEHAAGATQQLRVVVALQ